MLAAWSLTTEACWCLGRVWTLEWCHLNHCHYLTSLPHRRASLSDTLSLGSTYRLRLVQKIENQTKKAKKKNMRGANDRCAEGEGDSEGDPEWVKEAQSSPFDFVNPSCEFHLEVEVPINRNIYRPSNRWSANTFHSVQATVLPFL